RETGRVGAGDEPADLAVLLDLGRRLLPRHPGGVEATLDVLELRLVGALPPHAEQGVLRAGDDDPPVRVLVHTEVERIRVVAVALDKAEDLVAVPAPRVHVRRLDADVAEVVDSHELSLRSSCGSDHRVGDLLAELILPPADVPLDR